MMNETLGQLHFWITFIGVYCIFGPMHYIGLIGHMRRYSETTGVKYLAQADPAHHFMTIAAFITVGAQLIFIVNLFWSIFKGAKAPVNPWECTTLEWTIPSPPPHDNFAGHEPVVYRGPYEYGVPGAPQDFLMQTDPSEVGARH
jgi:cytochrome c oxidase subunit 1